MRLNIFGGLILTMMFICTNAEATRFDSETGLNYYKNRYHSTALGRFISRDPKNYIDGLNLYHYVNSQTTAATDPEGTDQTKLEAEFTAWFNGEVAAGLGWLAGLPDCPCRLTIYTYTTWYTCGVGTASECINPDPGVWDPPTEWLYGHHKGAKCCIRSKVPSGWNAGQQCCYDKDGALITNGAGAGTPDKVSPVHTNFGAGGHQEVDVKPADRANAIDGYDFGKFSAMYHQVRPPNNGNKCPKNP